VKVVKIGEDGITESDLLVHDAHCEDNTLQLKLAEMEWPVALGCHPRWDAPTLTTTPFMPRSRK
jgi:2-oxoglutarate ferredoxin oxidoreductase subunit beta